MSQIHLSRASFLTQPESIRRSIAHWGGPTEKAITCRGYLGSHQIFTNRAAQGIAECEQALGLDRNLANAHALIGLAKFLLGRGAETEPHLNEALHLSPRDTQAPRWMVWVGLAKAQLGAD
ncbi:MAG TPA: hypothetical protein VGK96_28210, partial [Candidatus Sulfotelmatobacter sp.]